MSKATEALILDELQVDDSGYLVTNARTARTGIQLYAGAELGRPDIPVVKVYRAEDEVFSKRSLDTFAHLPLTINHPKDGVNANNWKQHAVGTTGGEVLRDGEYLKIGIKITDAQAVAAVQSGKRELSVGYATEIVWDAGTAPDGMAYDAVMRNISANHIAIVDKGRAGSLARIGDSWNDFQPGGMPKTGEVPIMDQLKTVVLGDVAVQVAVTDVAAIDKYKADTSKQLADANAVIASKDEAIGKLRVELKAAQDAAVVDIDALVSARTELVSKVHAIDSKITVAGVSDADLRRAAVVAKLGADIVKDASDDQIIGMFKAIAKDAKPADPVGQVYRDGVQPVGDAATRVNDVYSASVSDLNAWRNQGA